MQRLKINKEWRMKKTTLACMVALLALGAFGCAQEEAETDTVVTDTIATDTSMVQTETTVTTTMSQETETGVATDTVMGTTTDTSTTNP
jgi:predicted RND superfamily exporter protein